MGKLHLNKQEMRQLRAWLHSHLNEDNLTFNFTNTGIGIEIKIKEDSGNVIDITDYESW